MSNNTENIEARLCAFVEGDLDEAARVEIEKHLQTHPAHRALLDELKRTKAMLISLPRELAPVDMAETLQGHLERSVLLDGVGTDPLESNLRINRWPQLIGVAAVVLLAAGLGTLVYVILPAHSASNSTFVSASEKEDKALNLDGAVPSLSTKKSTADKAADDAMLALKELGPVTAKPSADLALTPAPAAQPPADRGLTAGGVTPERLTLKDETNQTLDHNVVAAADGAARKGGTRLRADSHRVYLVVSTDNLETTNSQLAGYLTTNNIAWQPGNLGVVDDVALASRAQNAQYKLTNSVDNIRGNSGNNGANTVGNFGAGGGNSMVPGNNSKADQNAPGRDEPIPAKQAETYTQNNINSNYTSKSLQPQSTQAGALQQLNNDELNMKTKFAEAAPAVSPAGFDLAGSKAENVIVCRNVTREQAAEMADSLGKLYAGQTTTLVDHDPSAVAQNVIVQNKAEWARLAKAGAGRPMMPTSPMLPTSPTSPTTQPMLGLNGQPIEVTGGPAGGEQNQVMPSGVSSKGGGKPFAESAGNTNGKLPATSPETQQSPAATDTSKGQLPSLPPSGMPTTNPTDADAGQAAIAPPTTQPGLSLLPRPDRDQPANDLKQELTLDAQPTTRPADDAVDVLIVVQLTPPTSPNAGQTDAAAPTTQESVPDTVPPAMPNANMRATTPEQSTSPSTQPALSPDADPAAK